MIQTVQVVAEQALTIAQEDAARTYRDLTRYRIQLFLEGDRWHIDYEWTNPKRKGGGPHSTIDARSGAILSKNYEQ